MDITIDHLSKSYSSKRALNNINITFQAGSFTAVLGPSGCGKTTLMRCLAGFLNVDTGTIKFGEQDVTILSPQKRGTAMVFQNYALWPHMTVYDNIAFGLKLRKYSKREIEKKVYHILEMVEIDPKDVRKRYPTQYSGGQQQRIALARALVLEPKLLLMDEPLSNLDAKVRQRLRVEIRRIQKELGITAVYVTHDQEEALSMADQIVLMNEGDIVQTGTPEELYRKPQNYFAAQFIGTSNTLEIENRDGLYYLGHQTLSPALSIPKSDVRRFDLVIRARDAILSSTRTMSNDHLTLQGDLKESLFAGSGFRHWIKIEGLDLFVESDQEIEKKGSCYVHIPIDKCYLYEKKDAI